MQVEKEVIISRDKKARESKLFVLIALQKNKYLTEIGTLGALSPGRLENSLKEEPGESSEKEYKIGNK